MRVGLSPQLTLAGLRGGCRGCSLIPHFDQAFPCRRLRLCFPPSCFGPPPSALCTFRFLSWPQCSCGQNSLDSHDPTPQPPPRRPLFYFGASSFFAPLSTKLETFRFPKSVRSFPTPQRCHPSSSVSVSRYLPSVPPPRAHTRRFLFRKTRKLLCLAHLISLFCLSPSVSLPLDRVPPAFFLNTRKAAQRPGPQAPPPATKHRPSQKPMFFFLSPQSQ